MSFTPEQKEALLQLAWKSIRHGMERHEPLEIDPDDYPPELREPRCVFVTLEIEGELRGCMGTLDEWEKPLAANLARIAYVAAFSDPRFPPLRQDELKKVDLHISALTRPEPMSFSSESDLLSQIRPGVDGLILQDGCHRGTFLPAVWEKLPDKRDFWTHLKHKAGLPPDHWSDRMKVQRYTAESIP
ncbi:MAG: AmmeMemoRadiSam system protein A [Verrucomicrobiae bacterium]|nr:AmmeMemoRadiSam system protein A [Verrucomicrobiae bacterium]